MSPRPPVCPRPRKRPPHHPPGPPPPPGPPRAPPPPPTAPAAPRPGAGGPGTPAPARLFAGDREIGRITSAAYSPDHDAVVALGYLHRDFVEPGTEVTAVWDNAGAKAVVLGHR